MPPLTNPGRMGGRTGAGVLLVIDGRLALIDRVRPGVAPYSTLPGGGVEEGETPGEAAVREAEEQLGLRVELRSPEPAFLLRTDGHVQHHFVADPVGGTFGAGTGPEMVAPRPEWGTSTPMLVTPDEAVHRHLVPVALAEPVLAAFVRGTWPASTVEVVDPCRVPPVRVRAGAVVLDDRSRVLVHRADGNDAPFYEIPGGGVEEGETPETAVLRELEEEAGLLGEIVRPLARIWKDGRREHYFLLRPTGPSGRSAADLDVEPFFTPEWVPVADLSHLPVWPKRLAWRVARWHETGRWPDVPVELTDTIVDLGPPCRW